ncbi:MAG TPA: hypothetical protein PLW44_03170 [Chitinophagales bacterium]|nr:hypothetical protein [Chitinophagales bacterium]
MKRRSLILTAMALVALCYLQSCAVKRDCRGHLKHRLSNGIWI